MGTKSVGRLVSVALILALCGSSGCGGGSNSSSTQPRNQGGNTDSGSPAPLILSSLQPSSVPAGSSLDRVWVYGSGFQSGAGIRWNGKERAPTVFVSTTQMYFFPARLPLSDYDLYQIGSAEVLVINANLEKSNSINFNVTAVAPSFPHEVTSINSDGTSAKRSYQGEMYFATDATGRFLGFDDVGKLAVRDTCYGAGQGCTPSTLEFPKQYQPSAGSTYTNDARAIAFDQTNRFVIFQHYYRGCCFGGGNTSDVIDAKWYLADTCRGAAPNCILMVTPVSLDSASQLVSAEKGYASSDAQRVAMEMTKVGALNAPPAITVRTTCAGLTACTPATEVILEGTKEKGIPGALKGLSRNGRFLTFLSTVLEFVPPNLPGGNYGYVRDTCFGASSPCQPNTVMVTYDEAGLPVSNVEELDVDSSGRFVRFKAGNTSYFRDSCRGESACAPATTLFAEWSDVPIQAAELVPMTVSADRRWVVFNTTSEENNIVPNDTNSGPDVILRDTCFGVLNCTPSLTRLSVVDPGIQIYGLYPRISADGTSILYVGTNKDDRVVYRVKNPKL